MKREDVVPRVVELAVPVAEGKGIELVDVEYAVETGVRVLRIYIDKPGGVTLNDCAEVSRELGTALDVENLLTERYSLEVSSPGLDRKLTKEKDFVKYAGRNVKIVTKAAVDGRKNFKASIAGAEGGVVTVKDPEGKVWTIALSNIASARLIVEI
ncbi:MAG: ribosome maturation factor RimP [Deltaproteobacteria bacterium]|nr:ribosome maturation factor RimP [Deltaproteobacteria bacterium]